VLLHIGTDSDQTQCISIVWTYLFTLWLSIVNNGPIRLEIIIDSYFYGKNELVTFLRFISQTGLCVPTDATP